MLGRLVLMGSGELAPGLVATHRAAIEAAGAESVTLIDTPFGFQENADELTSRISDFFDVSLNRPMDVASLRLGGSSPLEVETAIAAVRHAKYVFSGPGAPTHAMRVWGGSDMGLALTDVIRGGGAVCFASAASLTLGPRMIPVYQIYKVGDPPHWHAGLGVTSQLGLPMVVVPHWNNAEGGTHDTSRCYVGLRRLTEMARSLEQGILGIDEHTAVTIDLGAGVASVTGVGGASVIGPRGSGLGSGEHRVMAGGTISIEELRTRLGATADLPNVQVSPPAAVDLRGAINERSADGVIAALLELEAAAPDHGGPAFRSALIELQGSLAKGFTDTEEIVGPFIETLLALRSHARTSGDYALADRVRDQLAELGVTVEDTPNGPRWALQ